MISISPIHLVEQQNTQRGIDAFHYTGHLYALQILCVTIFCCWGLIFGVFCPYIIKLLSHKNSWTNTLFVLKRGCLSTAVPSVRCLRPRVTLRSIANCMIRSLKFPSVLGWITFDQRIRVFSSGTSFKYTQQNCRRDSASLNRHRSDGIASYLANRYWSSSIPVIPLGSIATTLRNACQLGNVQLTLECLRGMGLVSLPTLYQRGFSFVNCLYAFVLLLHRKLVK